MTLTATGATAIIGVEPVQALWSGYGQIVRYRLEGARRSSVIVKHVRWPSQTDHPRGWNSDRSHQRKVRSYDVESAWYRLHAPHCGPASRVPECLAVQAHGEQVLMVLEDLDAVGFECRLSQANATQMEACLIWLADFHATFMGRAPEGLWPVGTYWHLSTRPDEFDALEEGTLKSAAATVDRKLNESPYQTFVHGDAKLANFCFSADGRRVAAVDFQYVGGGCGMKDVAYFISSCLNEDDCERMEHSLLDLYFHHLEAALVRAGTALDFAALHRDWRALYRVAWTDFYRFLLGWSPGHWKIHRYSERVAREVVAAL